MPSLSSPALFADDAPSTRRALVIDDSRALRSVLRRLLAARGYEVNEAGDGLEGVDSLARSGAVDLCLVDWNMPNMNGLDFIKTVRENPDYERMQIVMVTPESEPAPIARAPIHRADEYATKPMTADAPIATPAHPHRPAKRE